MLRSAELPPVSELLALDEDAVLSDPSPDWVASAVASLRRRPEEKDDDGLGFRSLLEYPEALPKAWEDPGRVRPRRRAARGHLRRAS